MGVLWMRGAGGEFFFPNHISIALAIRALIGCQSDVSTSYNSSWLRPLFAALVTQIETKVR